jgi:HEAT repeat protein
MTQAPSFKQALDALLDEANLIPAPLMQRFSDLEAEDLKSLHSVWKKVSLPRKLSLLEDLETLAEADSLVSFENLGKALLSDPDTEVRARAIHLLVECADVKLVPIYLDLLHHDTDPKTRAEAAWILGLFIYKCELDEIPASLCKEIEDNLIQVVGSDEPAVIRQRALESLGSSSRDEVPALIETAYHRKGPGWMSSALCAMGHSSDERWEKYILAHLLDQDYDTRSEAVIAAGKVGLSPARMPLLDLLADEEDPDLRRQIIWSLSEIGGEGVRVEMDNLLETETDADELEFLEDALENLLFTEDINNFNLLDLEDTDKDE